MMDRLLRRGTKKRGSLVLAISVWLLVSSRPLSSKEIITNNIHFIEAPEWITSSTVERVTGRVQNFLEWDIRRIKVRYHANDSTYQREHQLNFQSNAFFRRSDSTVHLSSRVTRENFEAIFGHELVHVIFFQKYREAIPKWLEEGLANHIGRTANVDYAWLSQQPLGDVTRLTHPDKDATGSRYHYLASTALIEMISNRCSLTELLRLSVGAKLTTYLGTYCEIKDINASFRDWVSKKSKERPGQKPARRWW